MRLKTLVILGVIIVSVIGAEIINKINSPAQEGQNVNLTEEDQIVVLSVNKGSGEESVFESQFKEKMTAFDLLQEKAGESGLVLKSKTYDVGVFIEAIGNKENGENEQYWMYYVNGSLPMVAADKYELKPGDKVEFRFEKPEL